MPRPRRIKVLIADDMVELRSNVRRMLGSQDSIQVIGEAGDGEEALKVIRELNPHVVLMDINMPRMDGLKVTEALAKELPNIQVVIMSIQSEQEYFRRAMKAGAKDFLTKPFSSGDLVDAIQNTFNRWVKDRPELQQEEARAEVLTFFATKGGVGRTTLATNLGISLAKRGKRTLLIDASLQFGDVAITLNQKAGKNLYNIVEKDEEITPGRIDANITHHSSGLDLLLAPIEPAYADAIKPQHVKTVVELMGGVYQYILFDTAPHMGNIELQILDQTDLVLLVGTLEISSMKNTKLCLKTLNDIKFDMAKVKLVINKDIPNVGISRKDIEEGLAIPIYAVVPMESETAQTALNQGEPFVVKFPKSSLANSLEVMTCHILGEDAPADVPQTVGPLLRLKKIIFGS
ncbi:MAG: MinD/ParA family protein [Candidatus Riflebacteria bacterium]|nr:MinD/ParA family protein [Candidatus Riflebacteria bacterium]